VQGFTLLAVPTLQGAHVLVTGGSSGIGLETARLAVGRGARVSLIARRADVLDDAAGQLRAAGGQVAVAAADVADVGQVGVAVSTLTGALGAVDVVICSAGQARPGYFEQLDPDLFRQMMDVNYFGTVNVVRAVVPAMIERRSGSVVGVSSAAGLVGVFGYTAYAPTKFAVRGFLESLRGELLPHGIHVGCSFPPDTDTPQLADENRYKPKETKAISGTIKPLSAERVARSIVEGIEKERFMIIPDASTRGLAKIAGLAPGLVSRVMDRSVRKVRGK
jgi:3-dehydrosphinganine reductase